MVRGFASQANTLHIVAEMLRSQENWRAVSLVMVKIQDELLKLLRSRKAQRSKHEVLKACLPCEVLPKWSFSGVGIGEIGVVFSDGESRKRPL